MNPSSAKTRDSIRYAAELLCMSQRTVVLTGAGISTPSGIPDFRSEDTGLWSMVDPMEVASLSAFRYDPERFYSWMHPLAVCIVGAQPNPAHLALARLEQISSVKVVITQNIDGLHQRAGSMNVLETHGTLQTMSCTHCFLQVESKPYIEPFLKQNQIPHCQRCSAILKPDVILFGEQLPQQTWMEALQASRSCDLMIVAGSSLEVLPVAGLPMKALDRGAHLIILNQTPTYLSPRADVVILENVAEVIPEIAEQVFIYGRCHQA